MPASVASVTSRKSSDATFTRQAFFRSASIPSNAFAIAAGPCGPVASIVFRSNEPSFRTPSASPILLARRTAATRFERTASPSAGTSRSRRCAIAMID